MQCALYSEKYSEKYSDKSTLLSFLQIMHLLNYTFRGDTIKKPLLDLQLAILRELVWKIDN